MLPFPTGAFVYDLVYNPPQTRLLHQAAAAGCRGANGLGMLARQAAEAFALWTGQKPDLSILLGAIQ
jgi:shikimate dehydrogenase